ncbi:hypothetical protein SanaruYs_27590 [Chryseotalea sanaruensis]|uniref:Uncharacterized protein n=1 Tax=Chryseotalea sanaruensis TaxID=2482724 RepID=A0A401UCC3_9BACT|nr:hypothetical protein [Chryseotalea sanaruensis]GCC52522.1 hypothetical protein SanaruYs_27590 [Chryseotalea sanaruensis]
MNKLIFILVSYLSFSITNSASSQTSSSSLIATNYNYLKTESAFLFTDNSVYTKGEKILYKVFVWGNTDLQEISNVAFVLLKNSRGRIIEQQRILINEGEGNGDIILSDSLTTDIYTVEVYTKWMQNFSETPLSLKNVWVGDPKQSLSDSKDPNLSVSIFPESGNFLADNLPNKLLIYPATYHPEGFRFELSDPDGKQIQNVAFDAFYGVTAVSIAKAGVYSYRICFSGSEKCITGILPTSELPSFEIAENSDGSIKVSFRNFESSNLNTTTLIAMNNGSIILSRDLKTTEDIVVKAHELRSGEIQVLLLNKTHGITAFQSFYNLKGEGKSNLKLVSEKAKSIDERLVYLKNDKNNKFKLTALVQPKEVAGYLTSVSELKKQGVDVDMLLSQKNYGNNEVLKRIVNGTDFEYNNYRFVSVNDSTRLINNKIYNTPIDLLLSGFDKPAHLDSILYFKSRLDRVKKTYELTESSFQKITPDKSFIPDDYTEIKSTKDFLDLAIPNLLPAPGSKNKEQVFSFTNLKEQKSFYSQPPIICLNGFILPSIKSIYDFPLSDISSIDIVYNAQSIIEQGVKDFFPNGVIFVFTKSKLHPLVQYSRSNFPFFSRGVNWPGQFNNNNTIHSDKRIPQFKTVYNWYPSLVFDDKRPVLCNTPNNAETEFYLTLLTMSEAREGVIERFRLKK